MFFGPDGDLMSIKWKIYKGVFRYSKGLNQPIVKPQFPMFYDLSDEIRKRKRTSSPLN